MVNLLSFVVLRILSLPVRPSNLLVVSLSLSASFDSPLLGKPSFFVRHRLFGMLHIGLKVMFLYSSDS